MKDNPYIPSDPPDRETEPFDDQIGSGPQIPLRNDWGDFHDFLFREEEQRSNPIGLVKQLRREIGEMPPEKGTFTIGDLTLTINDFPSDHEMIRDVMWFVGTWQVPGYFSNSKRRRWVNPSGAHAHTYPAVDVKCRCGARIVRADPTAKQDTGITNAKDHGEDCQERWRMRAKARVYDQREAILRYGFYLDYSGHELAKRVGVDPQHVARLCDKVGIDNGAAKQRGRQVRANTAERLLKSYSSYEIAKVYGRSGGAIRKAVGDLTDADMIELRLQRDGK